MKALDELGWNDRELALMDNRERGIREQNSRRHGNERAVADDMERKHEGRNRRELVPSNHWSMFGDMHNIFDSMNRYMNEMHQQMMALPERMVSCMITQNLFHNRFIEQNLLLL